MSLAFAHRSIDALALKNLIESFRGLWNGVFAEETLNVGNH